MLDSLYVKNFRIFNLLEVPALNRVNLFVGKNNTGKSCLLEALYLYETKFQNLDELIFERDEHWKTAISTSYTKNVMENPIRHLFHGFHLPELNNEGICIGSIKNIKDRINANLITYNAITQVFGRYQRELIEQQQLPLEISLVNDINNLSYALEIKSSSDRIGIFDFENLDFSRKRKLFLKTSGIENIQKVSAKNTSHSNLSNLWDNISLTSHQEDVISCLKIIEPQIIGLTFVGDSLSNRIPLVKLENHNERLPLGTFGDGMNRLLNIIIALVNAKDGTLLIDEAENGLHWSVHSKLWEIVFTLSEKLNVQVFATTHNRDCVQGFNEIWSKNQDSGSFYRLQRSKDDSIKAIQYDQETLSNSLEMEIEFR